MLLNTQPKNPFSAAPRVASRRGPLSAIDLSENKAPPRPQEPHPCVQTHPLSPAIQSVGVPPDLHASRIVSDPAHGRAGGRRNAPCRHLGRVSRRLAEVSSPPGRA